MQQELDRLCFGGDRPASRVGACQNDAGFGHHLLHLVQQLDLPGEFRRLASAGQDLPLHPFDLFVEPHHRVGHVELFHDPAHAFGERVLRSREATRTSLEGPGVERRPHLLRDTGLLAKICLGFQDQHRLQHQFRGQAFGRRPITATAIPAAILGRRHQFIGPAVERVRPEFRLGDRQARFLLHVVGELPEAAEHVEFLHLLEHGTDRRLRASLTVGIQIVHHRGELLPHLVVALGHGIDLPEVRLRLGRLSKGARHDRRQSLSHLQFAPRRGLEPLHECRALQPRHHVGQLLGYLRKILEQLPLLLDRLVEQFFLSLLLRRTVARFFRDIAHRRSRQAECATTTAAPTIIFLVGRLLLLVRLIV